MNRWLLLTLLIVAAVPAEIYAQCQIDTCYHTRQELYEFIFQLQEDYPQWVKVDSIGHSNGDMLDQVFPVYAVKISDNVQTFEDEPVALIVMHIHAEEVIGMEASIRYMRELVDPPQQHSIVRNNTQVYFIPTMNPDGLEIISDCIGVSPNCPDCLDPTWRKNGYHPPEMNGRDCNIEPGVGQDSCGVDLNRNFELNWIYGDSLWKPTASEPFDYYCGPSPFSEPEARAVRDLAIEIKPTISIVYHSSRSGNVAEQSIVAWQWGADPGPYKFPPDCTMIALANRRYVQLTDIEPGIGDFSHVWGGTHNGCLQDWFYWRLGTVQFLTETSPSNRDIQPPCATLTATINDMMQSLRWIQRRLLNLDADAPGPLAIYTRDAQSNMPISAEWRIVSTWNASLPPRMTNEEFGRMTILPPAGPITILARKEGYQDATASASIQPAGSPQSVTLNLQPLPWYTLTVHLVDESNDGVAGSLHIDGGYPRWVEVSSSGAAINLPQAAYKLMAVPIAGGRSVAWREFELNGDLTLDIALPFSSLLWSESFENGLDAWMTGGDGSNWRLDSDTTAMALGNCLHTNSTGYRTPYPNNANTWIRYNPTINLSGGNIAYLDFYRRGRLDVPTDSFLVEITSDGNSWTQVGGFCDHELPWTKSFINLSQYVGNNVQLRFRLISDNALGDLGIHVDNLRIFVGTDNDAPMVPVPSPFSFRLIGAYPNPFNPTTDIHYEVGSPGEFSIVIYDLLGRETSRHDLTAQLAGPSILRWNGTNLSGLDVPSGLYFARLEAGRHVSALKLLLIR